MRTLLQLFDECKMFKFPRRHAFSIREYRQPCLGIDFGFQVPYAQWLIRSSICSDMWVLLVLPSKNHEPASAKYVSGLKVGSAFNIARINWPCSVASAQSIGSKYGYSVFRCELVFQGRNSNGNCSRKTRL
jgi:hypothetical protein